MRSGAQVEGLALDRIIYNSSILIVEKARTYSEDSVDSCGEVVSMLFCMEQKPT